MQDFRASVRYTSAGQTLLISAATKMQRRCIMSRLIVEALSLVFLLNISREQYVHCDIISFLEF
jgi:hypothetical protein